MTVSESFIAIVSIEPSGTTRTAMRKRLYQLGCRISAWGSALAGHPMSILIVAIACAAWFIVGGPAAENTLTLILSVLAITLTQMVLNQQRLNERALHMKIDELVYAMKDARDEIAGIEGKSEEELDALRRTGGDADPTDWMAGPSPGTIDGGKSATRIAQASLHRPSTRHADEEMTR